MQWRQTHSHLDPVRRLPSWILLPPVKQTATEKNETWETKRLRLCVSCFSEDDIQPSSQKTHVTRLGFSASRHDRHTRPRRRLVGRRLVRITTRVSGSRHTRPNKNAFKATRAFISLSSHLPNQPRLHSRHIKNHKIPLCILQSQKKTKNIRTEEGERDEGANKQ